MTRLLPYRILLREVMNRDLLPDSEPGCLFFESDSVAWLVTVVPVAVVPCQLIPIRGFHLVSEV